MANRTKLLISLGSARVAFAEPSKVNLYRLAYIPACGIVKRVIELFLLCDDQLFPPAFSLKITN